MPHPADYLRDGATLPAAVAAHLAPSQLASDRTPLLTAWTARDEQDLAAAEQKVSDSRARRVLAEKRVAEALRDAGLDVLLVTQVVEHATAIRAALAPFDVKGGA